jgi:predicted extracellular nuclease
MEPSHSSARRVARLLSIGALLLALLAPVVGPVQREALADTSAQALPFSQDWSSAGLITTNDDWSGVPGIEGYLGQGLTASTGVDPQTLLSVSAEANDLDVIANQTNTGITNGGVAEFELTDPTIALQGSGTADAPYILISLNTTGQSSIGVSYNLRDIDGSADNAIQPVALQYRVGSSGDFANLPAGFVADATSGPSLATLVTPVSVTLPVEAENQPLVQLRIITTNAAGNDEWVGVDDLSVATVSGLPTVTLSVSTASASEADQTAVTVTATASAAVSGDQTVALAVTGAGVEAGDYQLSATTISIPDGQTSGSATFTVVDDNAAEGEETATLTISSPSAGIVLGATVARTVTIADNDGEPAPCPAGPAITKIAAIQGSGATAAITGAVTVEGVVTQIAPGLNGFYVQEEAADQDADAATSEGIFVFTGAANFAALTAGLAVGDVVRVSGNAVDFATSSNTTFQTQLSGALTVADCGRSETVTPVDVTFPLATPGELERYEGMLIRLPQELTIGEYFNFDQFGEVVLQYAAGIAELNGASRFYQPTNIVAPGAAANALAAEYAKRRITLDDGRGSQNPTPAIHPNGQPFTLQNRFRGGDTLAGVVGTVDNTFGLYRVQPTDRGTYTATNQRPEAPQAVGGRLQVGALNTLNYFLTPDYPTGNALDNTCGPAQNAECRGWDSNQPDELTRQRAKLLETLKGLDADVLGLNELENTPAVEPLADIVSGLNAALGAGTYSFIDTGVIGTDAIRVGMIYKPAAVTPVGPFQLLTTAVDPRFRDTLNRPVLAQSFRENATGELFTVAVTHLKSKGSACTSVGDPDQGDGQGNCNATRTLAAEALVDWLDATFEDPDFLIVGDLNSYAKEDPINTILAGSDGVAGNADDYVNLIQRFAGAGAYSYVFDGQLGYLDHALASAGMNAQVAGATEWHINADEPDLLDYDTSFKQANEDALYAVDPFRTSDHDPVLVGVNLAVPNQAPVATADTVSAVRGVPLTLQASVLLANDTDADGNQLVITAVGGATNGAVSLAGDVITFTPAAGFTGTASFSYTVSDGAGGTTTGTVTVEVAAFAPGQVFLPLVFR